MARDYHANSPFEYGTSKCIVTGYDFKIVGPVAESSEDDIWRKPVRRSLKNVVPLVESVRQIWRFLTIGVVHDEIDNADPQINGGMMDLFIRIQ